MDEYQMEFETDLGQSYHNCPACGKELAVKKDECFSCGVVFSKVKDRIYQQTTHDQIGGIDHLSVGELKQLDRRWKQVVVNYHDQTAHHDFINYCQRCGSLPFAVYHYTKMLDIDKEDDIAEIMRKQSLSRLTFQFATAVDSKKTKETIPRAFAILKLIAALLLFMGTAFILVGFFTPNAKNLVGLGAALSSVAMATFLYRR